MNSFSIQTRIETNMAERDEYFYLLIVGSRNFYDSDFLFRRIDRWINYFNKFNNEFVLKIISGGCTGVDSLAIKYAKLHNIEYEEYPANWNMGDKGGPIRNSLMVKKADAVIAFPSRKGKGTQNTIEKAKRKGFDVLTYYVD